MQKNRIVALLLFLFIVVGVFCFPVFSKSTSVSTMETADVKVKISADKSEYSATDDIETILEITNICNTIITDIVIDTVVPDGYTVSKTEAHRTIKELAPGETSFIRVEYDPTGELFASKFFTSIYFYILLGVLLLLIALIIYFILKRKKKKGKESPSGVDPKNITCIILAFVLIASAYPSAFVFDSHAETKSFDMEMKVKVEQLRVKLHNTIRYDVPDECCVYFESNGGSKIEKQLILEGQCPMIPEIPMRDDYVFVGWYTDEKLSNQYDFSTPVTKDMTLYARWTNIYLSVSNSEFFTGDSGTVYFYAETTVDTPTLFLKDASNGTTVLELKDDGKYSVSGDDLPNDNIFSGKMVLSSQAEAKFNYYAFADDNENSISQTISIQFIEKLSDKDLMDIAAVDERIQTDFFENENYEQMSVDERKDLIESILADLAAENLIEPDSITYNQNSNSFTFMYASGVNGAVIFKTWQTGSEGATDNDTSSTNSIQPVNYSLSNTQFYLGEAIILWSFDQAWDNPNFRQPFYSSVEQQWDKAGLNTTVVWDTTVEHYKKLKGYDVIIFSGHGDYDVYNYDGKTVTCASLLLHERANENKNTIYSADLSQFRVGLASVRGGTMYSILPKFFEHYYGRGDLEGSFVFAENCEFRGEYGRVNAEMPNALRNASAETIVGFHNSVMAEYSRNVAVHYVNCLIEGKNAFDSYNAAIEEYGETDYFIGRQEYGPTAYPLFFGNSDAYLVEDGIENGSFEQASTAKGWMQAGDVRVLSTLSTLVPTDNAKMAILTTGIGSAEDDYLGGTEGSVMSQVFRVPQDSNQLMFSYNMVSEEPYEFVGSKYDDTFLVRLVTQNETVQIAKNNINNAKWVSVTGINFDDGDETTYQTAWQNISFDISKYAGEIVRIEFIVYDVGDSIYDTATLVDNIRLE